LVMSRKRGNMEVSVEVVREWSGEVVRRRDG
jgi:hypothetical protein